MDRHTNMGGQGHKCVVKVCAELPDGGQLWDRSSRLNVDVATAKTRLG